MKRLFIAFVTVCMVTGLMVSCIDKSVIKEAIKEAAEEAYYDDDDDFDEGFRDSGKWGKVVTKEILLSDFKNIVMDGHVDVIYNNGDTTRVTIHGNEEVIGMYSFRSEGGVLEVRPKKSITHRMPSLTLHIVTPDLASVQLNGTGDLDIRSRVSFGDFAIYLNGTGDVDISDMECNSLVINDTGTGDIKLRNVECRNNANIVNPGTGDVKAYVTANCITIDNSGTGDVELDVECTNLIANSSGTGEIELKGQTDLFTRNVGSLSKIDSKKLRAKTINR